MIKLAMSPAASALLRALIARADVPRDRILLTDVHSTDWQSLTFTGERHQLGLRIAGPGASEVASRICDGLGDAEFEIGSVIVADIAVVGDVELATDGSATFTVEALTIAAD